MKKMITPRFITQKQTMDTIPMRESPFCRIMEKITDRVIRERGKEKPRKNVFSTSFSI